MTERKVYILLTNTGSFLTKLIKLYTKKPYNHASIAFDCELTEIYSFGRKTARNPFIGGFVKEDVQAGLFKQADCVIYSLTVTEVQFQRMHQYLQEFKIHKHRYRYNFLGLFGVVFNKPVTRKKAYFCSQFVGSVLHDCNAAHFEKHLSLITPHDLQKVTKIQFVYEGKLKDYHHQSTKKPLRSFPFVPVEI
jgi:hypothetical protein